MPWAEGRRRALELTLLLSEEALFHSLIESKNSLVGARALIKIKKFTFGIVSCAVHCGNLTDVLPTMHVQNSVIFCIEHNYVRDERQ